MESHLVHLIQRNLPKLAGIFSAMWSGPFRFTFLATAISLIMSIMSLMVGLSLGLTCNIDSGKKIVKSLWINDETE